MPFVGRVVIEARPDRRWQLVEALTYQGALEQYDIEAGFLTDGASWPVAIRWLGDPFDTRTIRAAALHDKLWSEHRAGRLVSRRDADGLFRRVLREEGVPLLQRWLMWAGVRLGDFFEGGMTAKEWLAFLALLVPGIVIGLVSLPLVLVRALLRLPDWLAGL